MLGPRAVGLKLLDMLDSGIALIELFHVVGTAIVVEPHKIALNRG